MSTHGRRARALAPVFVPLLALAAVALGLLLPPGAARATTLRYQSATELADQADAVVWATVTRVGTRLLRGPHGLRPEREALLDVRELLLGQAPVHLRVQLRGGAHLGGERRVEGEARLREGEEVVLFLTREGDAWRVLGMGLGVFRVERDEEEGARLVRRVEDAVVLDRRGRPLPPVAEVVSMATLRAALRGTRRSP